MVLRGNPLDGITWGLTDGGNAPVGVAAGVRGGVGGVRDVWGMARARSDSRNDRKRTAPRARF
jgi:hypothetical protein